MSLPQTSSTTVDSQSKLCIEGSRKQSCSNSVCPTVWNTETTWLGFRPLADLISLAVGVKMCSFSCSVSCSKSSMDATWKCHVNRCASSSAVSCSEPLPIARKMGGIMACRAVYDDILGIQVAFLLSAEFKSLHRYSIHITNGRFSICIPRRD